MWESLLAGRSGAGTITQFDPAEHRTKIACEVSDFVIEEHLDPKEAKRMDRFTQFAMVAANEAMADSGLPKG
jgi:3-oxoacyl-[acyl-carrier-protein] synthase II